jgi:quinol-cytochrome oxidoreductase complex cytochrome b subunit
VRSARFRPIYKWFFWIFALDCIVLGYAGSQPAEGNMLIISRIATIYYFVHFIFLMPVLGWFERPKPLPTSISEAVLAGKASTSAGENA